MRAVLIACFVASAAFAAPAHAFEEQKTDEPTAKTVAGLQSDAATKPSGSETGTAIQIPGLGKLGVIPKLDFGLDLLYGTRQSATVEAPEVEAETDDLRIRGSIRHRF